MVSLQHVRTQSLRHFREKPIGKNGYYLTVLLKGVPVVRAVISKGLALAVVAEVMGGRMNMCRPSVSFGMVDKSWCKIGPTCLVERRDSGGVESFFVVTVLPA
tara:strand:- start:21567 stop:21875 length:309 start_codon:yes stop_codon:yes gene_type:complete